MADFFQNGLIATLHRLSDRPVESIEAELKKFSRKRPMALVLPALYSELEGEALPKIVEELKHVDYLQEIVVGLDRATKSEFEKAKEFFDQLPQPHRVIWQDGPEMLKLHELLHYHGLSIGGRGKAAMPGLVLATSWQPDVPAWWPSTTAISLPTTGKCWRASFTRSPIPISVSSSAKGIMRG